MLRVLFAFAALNGLISVVMGAFGSHALRDGLSERSQHAFETAVSYQMTHALALALTCLLLDHWGRHWALWYAAWFYGAGILLFSGSLYLLVLTTMKWPGPVTPLGGVCLLIGWGLLVAGIWQNAPTH